MWLKLTREFKMSERERVQEVVDSFRFNGECFSEEVSGYSISIEAGAHFVEIAKVLGLSVRSAIIGDSVKIYF